MGEIEYEGVRPASKSTIEIDFPYHGQRCRERIKLKPTPTNLKRAARHRAAVLDAIENGTFDYTVTFPDSARAKQLKAEQPASTPLGKYLETWLRDCKDYVKSSTWDGYRKMVRNQLIPAFGHIALGDFRRLHAKNWAREKADTGASAKTIGNIISPLRVALDEAVEDEIIDTNPLAGWKLKRRVKGARKVDKIEPFNQDERQAILEALQGQAHNQIEFAFWTGLRTSELAALDWDDVDWQRGSIFVTKALTQAAEEPEAPKTEAGEREIELLPPALAALKRQKAHTYLKGQEIFQNPRTGERWAGDKPIRESLWRPALKRAKVRYRYPYQTRHTFASMMLMAGEDVKWVSRMMGHTDWTFTARTYSRFIPADAGDSGSRAVSEYWDNRQHLVSSDE